MPHSLPRPAALCALFLALSLLIAPASYRRAAAMPSPPGSSDKESATPPQDAAEASAKKLRALAEKSYAKGLQETEGAKKRKKEGKAADAAKRYAKALERFEEAAWIDSTYAEAWNMVGYCARNVGDLKKSFAAYERALALMPDSEEAHEYLGEAYVMAGDLPKAKEQLEWLRAKNSKEAEELAKAIEAAEKGGASTGAPPDSTASPESRSGW